MLRWRERDEWMEQKGKRRTEKWRERRDLKRWKTGKKESKRSMRQTDGESGRKNKEKGKIRVTWGHFITSPKDKKAQLPKGLVVPPFFFPPHSISTSPHPRPPVLIIQLYQGGGAFFCPAWMWKVRPVIKPVIRQTWEEELDHCVSPSSNEQRGSRCPLPTQPATDEACASFHLRGKREENTARWLAVPSALNPLLVASKLISVWKL